MWERPDANARFMLGKLLDRIWKSAVDTARSRGQGPVEAEERYFNLITTEILLACAVCELIDAIEDLNQEDPNTSVVCDSETPPDRCLGTRKPGET